MSWHWQEQEAMLGRQSRPSPAFVVIPTGDGRVITASVRALEIAYGKRAAYNAVQLYGRRKKTPI